MAEQASIFTALPENLPKKKEPEKPGLPTELQGKSAEEVAQILTDEHTRLTNQMKADEFDKSKKEPEKKPPGTVTVVDPTTQQQQQQAAQVQQPVTQAQGAKPSIITDP